MSGLGKIGKAFVRLSLSKPIFQLKITSRGSSGVEQLIRNQQVVSSNLILGSTGKFLFSRNLRTDRPQPPFNIFISPVNLLDI
jgi:hypothetical protein